jgi:hypothetical protein
MNNTPAAPVVLQLAPLPREQIGPFLLLGVAKTADRTVVERNWADRLKWARRELIKVPLQDINWAREVLSDIEKRIRADAASLNLDSAGAVLRGLEERFASDSPAAARCQPLDVEKDLADYSPAVDIPDADVVRAGIVVPDIPEEVPAALSILESFLRQPLDPWDLPVSW